LCGRSPRGRRRCHDTGFRAGGVAARGDGVAGRSARRRRWEWREILVPIWAEQPSRTPWHPAHLAERFGLFTIIVLGESVLAATVGVQRALDGNTGFADLAPVVVGGLLILFSMWSAYFDIPTGRLAAAMQRSFADRTSPEAYLWGYGHYFVFASAAAVGAGLAVAVDQATHRSELSDLAAGFAITVPVALYLVAVWALHMRHKQRTWVRNYAVPIAALLILASSATSEPVLVTGLVLAALVVASVATTVREQPRWTS
jgi:low temperature requirement protein LtrA